jgi:autotransporter-associated beta strand protein
LVLSGSSTFAGNVTVSDGILRITHANALGANTKTVAVSGGLQNPELQLQGGITVSLATLKTSGDGLGSGSGALRNVSGDNVLNLSSSAVLTSGNGSSWWQSDAGTLTINSGVTTDVTDRELTLRGAGNGIINGIIQNGTTVALPLFKEGTGTWTLSGANTYSGQTTVSGGVLRLDHDNALPGGVAATGGTSALLFSGSSGGVIGLTAATGDFTRNIIGLTPGATDVGWANGAWGGFAAFGGNRTVNFGGAGATVTWNISGGVLGSRFVLGHSTSDSTITVANPIALNGAIRNVLVNDGSAAVDAVLGGALTGGSGSGLNKEGSGTLALTGASTYGGATTASAGTLQLGNGGTAGSLNTASTISVASGASFAINRSDTVTQGVDFSGAAISGAGGFTQAGAGTTVLNAANTYSGQTTVSGGVLTLNGTVANSTIPGNLTTTDFDVLINGGKLRLAASEQLGNTTGIDLTSGELEFGSPSGLTETIGIFRNSGGTFTSGANTLTGTGASITWSGGVNTISAGGLVQDAHWIITGGANTVEGGATRGTLQVQSGGDGLEFGGTASPTVTLNSDNSEAGRILLQGNVTVLGTLTAGTAQILNGGAASNPGFVDLDGGTRTFTVNNGSAATDLLVSARIENGAVTKAGDGTMTLTGVNTYSGATTINGGVLQLGDGGAGGSLNTASAVSVGSGASFAINQNDTVTQGTDFSGAAITGAGGFIQAGSGTTVLNANNTFTGPTAINAGTLEAGAAGALGGTSDITLNTGGTLLLSGTGNRVNDSAGVTLAGGTLNTAGLSETVGVLTLTANSIIDLGAGASILNFANSSGASWSGTLSIWNWTGTVGNGGGTDQLVFAGGTGGLTGAQLSQIQFFSDTGSTLLAPAIILSSGEVVPVPEPATWFTIFGLAALVGLVERRRAAQILVSLRDLRRRRS